MNKGVKIFGKTGVNTIFREMNQFNDRNVVKPLKKYQITQEVRNKALGYLMFLKEKRTGEIKSCGCVDGRSQRLYKSKAKTSSPIVATESIFISSVNDAKEGRDVAHVDIPGAFLQTEASDGTLPALQWIVSDS